MYGVLSISPNSVSVNVLSLNVAFMSILERLARDSKFKNFSYGWSVTTLPAISPFVLSRRKPSGSVLAEPSSFVAITTHNLTHQ